MNHKITGGDRMSKENVNQDIELETYLVSDIQRKLRCSKNKAYEIVKDKVPGNNHVILLSVIQQKTFLRIRR